MDKRMTEGWPFDRNTKCGWKSPVGLGIVNKIIKFPKKKLAEFIVEVVCEDIRNNGKLRRYIRRYGLEYNG
jgi:hypothetical protein